MIRNVLIEITEKPSQDFENCPRVELGGFLISLEEMQALLKEFSKETRSFTLDFSNRRISSEAMLILANFLKINSIANTLNLSWTKSDTRNIGVIAQALAVNTGIDQVEFFGNKMGDEGAFAIAQALVVNRTIRAINLESNKIGPEGARSIAKVLAVNPVIRQINLWNNKIGDKGVCAIAEVLKANSTIHTLSFGCNKFGDRGAFAIASVLAVNGVIHRIDLQNNEISAKGACAIASALSVNTRIRKIYLWGNRIGDKGARVIAEALKINSSVHTLVLAYNYIHAEGARAISETLKINSIVRTLGLSGNQIGDKGASAISEVLEVNSIVRTLDLESNQIGNKGACVIARMLEVNSALQNINLTGNRIGYNGARAIASALKGSLTILTLNLGGNQIGDKGACAIAEALRVNSTIHTLYLGSNQIGAEGARAIAEALKVNSSVSSLYLENNQIDDEGIRAISEVLKENFRLISVRSGFHFNYEKFKYYLDRNKKIEPCLNLLFSLKKIALEKKLPSEEENRSIQSQWGYFKGKISETQPDSGLLKERVSSFGLIEELLKLAELVEVYLEEKLSAQEIAELNQQSYGIKSTCALLREWKSETDDEDMNCAEELMASIPEDHPLRGEAHIRAVNFFLRKMRGLIGKENKSSLSDSELESVLEFLSHCALARKYGVSRDRMPSALEGQVLSCFIDYLSGEGWGHEAKIQSAEKGVFSNPKLIEWLKRNVKKLAENERKLKFVAFDMKNKDASHNVEDVDEEMDVVLLANTKSELLKAFESKASRLYPHAIITDAPLFLDSEKSPFQKFLKWQLRRYCNLDTFENVIKEIRDRYKRRCIDLSQAEREAKQIFIEKIACSNNLQLFFLFNFIKNNEVCDFIHEQKNKRWDWIRVSLFGRTVRVDGGDRRASDFHSNRWWNTAPFSWIVKEMKLKWVENERKGDVSGIDREVLLGFDCGNLFNDTSYSKSSRCPILR